MSFAGAFLSEFGKDATLMRTPPVSCKVTLMRTSRNNSDPVTRDSFWRGHANVSAVSGDLLKLGDTYYLVQSVGGGTSEQETPIFTVRCNALLTITRQTKALVSGEVKTQWTPVSSDVRAWGAAITARMRAEDVGLLDSARYYWQVQVSLGVQVGDRVAFSGGNYKVESIDNLGMEGVVRIQASQDIR